MTKKHGNIQALLSQIFQIAGDCLPQILHDIKTAVINQLYKRQL
jgi:hypothetical protein